MSRRHFYKHLDDGPSRSRLTTELTTREVAERIEEMNYGTHRFLSHLVDVRREALAARVADWRASGHHDIAVSAERRGDELADAIEKLLNKGLY